MTQSLVLIGLFLGLLACLPWFISLIKKRYGVGLLSQGEQTRVVSAVAIGPTQRVVTVEVGPDSDRTWLVLGVTQQSVACLHSLPAPRAGVPPVTGNATSAGTTGGTL